MSVGRRSVKPASALEVGEAIVSERAVALLMEACLEVRGLPTDVVVGRGAVLSEHGANLLAARGGEAALRRLAGRCGMGAAVPSDGAAERLALSKALGRDPGPGAEEPLRLALDALRVRARESAARLGEPEAVSRAAGRLQAHGALDAEGLALWAEYEDACFEHGVGPTEYRAA